MIHNEIISWVSVNSSKPDRDSNNFSLVIQSTNKWADKNLVVEKYAVKEKNDRTSLLNFENGYKRSST